MDCLCLFLSYEVQVLQKSFVKLTPIIVYKDFKYKLYFKKTEKRFTESKKKEALLPVPEQAQIRKLQSIVNDRAIYFDPLCARVFSSGISISFSWE